MTRLSEAQLKNMREDGVEKKPRSPRRQIEHGEQAAFFEWVDYRAKRDRRFSTIFAVPNGFFDKSEGWAKAYMMAEGLRPGVPDIVVPVPRFIHLSEEDPACPYGIQVGPWVCVPGLVIEMKAPGRQGERNGGLSDPQVEWREYMVEHGWKHVVAYGCTEAQQAVADYFGTTIHS